MPEPKTPTATPPTDSQNYHESVQSLLTPLAEAVSEIKRRRQDPALMAAVRSYLQDDIPSHFDTDTPIFYLCRHIATPNHETLHFIEKCQAYDATVPMVIGQDFKDIFSPDNVLKHNLGKLPVETGKTSKGLPIVHNYTILDFNHANGQPLHRLHTVCDTTLIDFHTRLLQYVTPAKVELIDESDWVSRHHRGNLLEHYKKLLALLIVHGIMFEFYEPEDEAFVEEVLIPACAAVRETFGHAPLITHLVEPERELERDWNAYGDSVLPYVEACVAGKRGGFAAAPNTPTP